MREDIKIFIIACLIIISLIAGSSYICYQAVSKAGGGKQIVITLGKEIKDIMNQIKED